MSNQSLGFRPRAVLEHRMREGMGTVGVGRPKIQAPLSEIAAEPHGAVLGMRPAAIGQEPPVIGFEMIGIALAQVDTSLVVIGHAGECEQAEGSERQRHDHDVTRPFVDVGQRRGKGIGRLPRHGEGQRCDVTALPGRAVACDEVGCLGDRGLCVGGLDADRIGARQRRMGEREIGVSQEGLLQRLHGARPGGEKKIDTLAVEARRFRGVGRNGEAAAVDMGHSDVPLRSSLGS